MEQNPVSPKKESFSNSLNSNYKSSPNPTSFPKMEITPNSDYNHSSNSYYNSKENIISSPYPPSPTSYPSSPTSYHGIQSVPSLHSVQTINEHSHLNHVSNQTQILKNQSNPTGNSSINSKQNNGNSSINFKQNNGEDTLYNGNEKKRGFFSYLLGLDMKKTRGLLIVFLIFLFIAAPTFAYLDNLKSLEKNSYYTSPISPFSQSSTTLNGLTVLCNITLVDIANFQFKMAFIIYPSGTYATNSTTSNPIYARLTRSISVSAGPQTWNFKAGQPMSAQQLSLTFKSGNVNQYPFDKYQGQFMLNAYDTINSDLNIPISFAIAPSTFGFNFLPIEVISNDNLFIFSSMQASRSFTVQFFSLFIIISLWILSLTAFALSASLWLRDRKVEPPTIGKNFIVSILTLDLW